MNRELIVCLSWIVYWQCMHSCCSWMPLWHRAKSKSSSSMVQCTKKNSRECLWVVECWNSIQVPKRHSRDFFYFFVIACISALSLSNLRVHTRIVCQKRVYICRWSAKTCVGSCIHATDSLYTHVVTRMSLVAMIHLPLHGPDTFFPKSFCAARSTGMSPIPCCAWIWVG